MITLILLLIIGSALAYVSHDNLMLVSLHVGPYVFRDIPLFYVIIGSLLTGLVLAFLMKFLPSISGFFTLRGKNRTIAAREDDVLELTKRIHQLEIENKKLKNTSYQEPDDRNAL